MNNAELIKQLRGCKDIEFCNECPRMPNGIIEPCGIKDAAADLIEAQAKRIEELNTKCADLQSQINSMESEIEELLPKEGWWISNYDGFDYDVRCSVCGEEALIKEGGSHDYAYSRYCPNCGARMKGEQDG